MGPSPHARLGGNEMLPLFKMAAASQTMKQRLNHIPQCNDIIISAENALAQHVYQHFIKNHHTYLKQNYICQNS